MDELKKYQKFRDSCKYCQSKDGEGLWCVDKNFKCSYINCPMSHPSISFGTLDSKKSVGVRGGNDGLGVTEKQVQVFKLKESGLSFKRIGDKLGMTKKNAWKLYQKAIRVYKYRGGNDNGGRVTKQKDGGNDIRLHNDVVDFEIPKLSLNNNDPNIRHLKYVSYLNLNLGSVYVKVFSKKLIVGFREDIISKSVAECKVLADERIKSFLSSFEYKGVDVVLDGEIKQVSRHYAILGTELAKKFVKEREKIYVYDRVDGKRRISIDFSNEKPEFEAEHLVHGDTDAEKWHSIIEDVSHEDIDLFSVTKKKTDLLLSDFLESKKTLLAYQEQIKLHLKVENNTNELQKNQNIIQEKTLSVLDNINDTLKEIKEIAKK